MEQAKRKIAYWYWIWVVFLVTVPISSALADAEYTYEFTANPGQVTWYNGTTIEIDVSLGPPYPFPPYDEYFNVVHLDFHGVLDLAATAGDPPYYGPTPGSLTPFSFSSSGPFAGPDLPDISSANAFGWVGSFTGYGEPYFPQDPVSLSYLVTSSGVFFTPYAGGTGQPIITDFATGTWSLVPDAGSSLGLFSAALVFLAVGRRVLGRPGNYGKR